MRQSHSPTPFDYAVGLAHPTSHSPYELSIISSSYPMPSPLAHVVSGYAIARGSNPRQVNQSGWFEPYQPMLTIPGILMQQAKMEVVPSVIQTISSISGRHDRFQLAFIALGSVNSLSRNDTTLHACEFRVKF